MDILDDDIRARFIALFACAFPWLLVVHCMQGSLLVIFYTVIHEGADLPLSAEPGSRRIIGFCGLSTRTVCYATHHTTPPFWAFKTKVSCGVVGCRRKPTSEKCFRCGVHVLCGEHSAVERSK